MNDRFKFRVWDEGMFEDSKPHYEYASVYTGLTLKMATGHHPIEQCTGFSDKNGNLIYEGDIVKSPNNSNGLVVYYDITGLWRCKENRENGMWELPLYDLVRNYGVEIIGNIHETKGENNGKDN